MNHKLQCELISSESVADLTDTLSELIRASGFTPDLVVAVSRGGFTPARLLCDVLGLFNLTSIRIKHYRQAATKERAATVQYPMSIPVCGLRVLVVDDVNDTGDTLRVARAHLETLGPVEIRTAVLHEKVTSPIRADYAAAVINEWRWLIYPWAVVEDVGGFLRSMQPPPADAAEASARLSSDYGLTLSEPRVARLLRLNALIDSA
ncbi:MAG: phosphoribosyltransferase [Sphingobacteriia bacterium]|nr:phosphoribosyltransferase [Sphingobacteriia bacterium]NCC38833.1 phosphoribosyltransferase [Gammaproteobacteria bacterium]